MSHDENKTFKEIAQDISKIKKYKLGGTKTHFPPNGGKKTIFRKANDQQYDYALPSRQNDEVQAVIDNLSESSLSSTSSQRRMAAAQIAYDEKMLQIAQERELSDINTEMVEIVAQALQELREITPDPLDTLAPVAPVATIVTAPPQHSGDCCKCCTIL